jgi:integral membrane sensor domain MASE1
LNEVIINLTIVALVIFILNLPFGYWRSHVKKFSFQWVLAIHLPVPLVVLLRIYSGIGFEFITYPILIAAFFLGQFIGSKIYQYRKMRSAFPLSACLIYDTYRKS